MNASVIRAALLDLESTLSLAREAKRQIEANKSGQSLGGPFYEHPDAALTAILTDLRDTLLDVLEAAELPQARARLMQQSGKWARTGGIGHAHYDEQYDYLECPAFEYVARVVKTLRMISGDGLTSIESYELARLKTVLRKTAMLLHRRGITPASEKDIRDVMHDYLTACFTEYTPRITITGIIKNFKPDGGVRDLKAAIEFKFAKTEDEVAKALGGIFEDGGGYKGSLDWTRFYTVIYQTEPFQSEDRFRSEMRRAGLATWTPVLVTGAGVGAKATRKGRTKSGS